MFSSIIALAIAIRTSANDVIHGTGAIGKGGLVGSSFGASERVGALEGVGNTDNVPVFSKAHDVPAKGIHR
eukprot:scaffold74264_cov31-Attheya_sp.AAC.1